MFGVIISEYKVINIENKYDEMVTHFVGINIGVRMRSRKANVKKKAIHFNLPSPMSLLKAIGRFLKVVNKMSHFEYC